MKLVIKLTILILITSGIYAMPTAVLFDCDGVLVDTEFMKFKAWQEALHAENVHIELEDYMTIAGGSSRSISKAIQTAKNCNFNTEKVITHKNHLYKTANKQGVPIIQPAVDYLNALLAQKNALNIKIAVVSSDAKENIIRNLQFAGVQHELLDGIFSGHDDLKHINDPEGTNKPKPYIYQYTASALQIDPKTTIVFEDTNSGVISAVDAGMTVIAVPNEFSTRHDFTKAKLITKLTTFTIQDLMQLN